MAAGLGFKDFVTGEVLTAADVDGYLMQGVWVFASAAARDSAVTSPQEGNFAYLKDTNVTTYYTGSAWANLDTTGMTNPMTTTGDTIYSSSGSTPARLGIGSTGQVLTVAGGVPTWAAPAGGSKILQVVNVMKTDSFTTTSTSFTDITGLSASITPSASSSKILVFATLSMVGASGTNGALSRLLRDSTVIVQSDAAGSRDRSMSQIEAIATTTAFTSVSYLDTPSSTSALTYKIQTRSNVASQTVYINRTITDADVAGYGRSVSSITLMEVGA